MSLTPFYQTICEKAVRAAGAEILRWVGRTETRKKGPTDLVTQADLAAQEVVRRTVLGAFPSHSLLGEEDKHDGQPAARTEFRWIVDPLDGTTNFVHGMPHYCVSLALEREGAVLVGAVYDPNRDECFSAAAGKGAWLNGRPIRTSGVTELGEALAVGSFPYQIDRNSPDLTVFMEAVLHCQSIRRTGSAALNLCYVAAGRMDLFWSFSTHIWDVAAGLLLVQEAGGATSAPDGGPLDLESGVFLAAGSEPLRTKLQELVARAVRK